MSYKQDYLKALELGFSSVEEMKKDKQKQRIARFYEKHGREEARRRNREANLKFINNLEVTKWLNDQKNNPCLDCGKTYHICQMDFDHVSERGKKFFGLNAAGIRNRKLSEVIEERSKCELVCANCHRLRTYLRYRENDGKIYY